ncbi:MAG: hypothetical protein KJ971_00515 [Firmicutes bacterium]|nr:hypothetical protein [Bacillota bacterium]
MKKKMMFMLLLMFSVFGFIGCTSGGSDVDIDYTEFYGIPTNLTITNTILTWDEVVGAKGYIVYVDGVKAATVSTNRYDFTSRIGDKFIFQVQTEAPRGYQDSPLSASIAYVVHRATEINAISALMEDSLGGLIEIPDGVAEALVDKGMISDDFEDMQTALTAFLEAVGDSGNDITLINSAFTDLVDSGINIEALLSGMLLFMPNLMQSKIDLLESDIEYYQGMIAYFGGDEYYENLMDEANVELDMYNNLLDSIEESSEEIVVSLLHVVNYFLSIHEQISENLVSQIVDLSNVDNPNLLVTNEVILVKEEIVSLMLDNLPSMEDMVLLYEMAGIFGEILADGTAPTQYIMQSAAQTILSLEAFAKFIDTFDDDFVDEMKSLSQSETAEMFQAEMMILAIKYFDRFQNDNEGLIEEIRNVYSLEQQEAMFDSYIDYIIESASDTLVPALALDYSNILFTNFKDVSEYTYDLMDPVLKWFVKSDGEVLRQSVILSSYIVDDFFAFPYSNTALDITYDNYTDYYLAKMETQRNVVQYITEMIYIVLGETTDADTLAITELILSVIPFDSLLDTGELSTSQRDTLKTAIETTALDEAVTLVDLLTALLKYEDDNDLFEDLNQVQENIANYYMDEYGSDYLEYDSYESDDYSSYALAILFAKNFDSFMNSTNKNRVNELVTAVFAIAKTAEYRDISGMTLSEIEVIETALVTDFLDYLIDNSDVVKGYNVNSLTNAQKAILDDYVDVLNSGPLS